MLSETVPSGTVAFYEPVPIEEVPFLSITPEGGSFCDKRYCDIRAARCAGAARRAFVLIEHESWIDLFRTSA